MEWRIREPLRVFARGGSLRRRVAYSLAVVRLILVPVILLAIYYLFQMGWIVDRIVGQDAPAATLASQISIQMLEARRAERNYFLLHDPEYLTENRESLARVKQIFNRISDLEPQERPTAEKALAAVNLYEQRFAAAIARLEEPKQDPIVRIQAVVRAYEKDLNDLLIQSGRQKRARLIDEVRARVESFDTEITDALEAGDPVLRPVTADIQASSQDVLRMGSELERRSWQRVQQDHQDARQLVSRAEWVLGIVSGFTLLLSVWISFILPRQTVKPLVNLREAIDHAAAGNYEIEFDVQGKGEVVQLANSVRSLIAHLRSRA